jgi:hypothetical protein
MNPAYPKLVELAGSCRSHSNNFSPIKINDLQKLAGCRGSASKGAHTKERQRKEKA